MQAVSSLSPEMTVKLLVSERDVLFATVKARERRCMYEFYISEFKTLVFFKVNND